MINKDKNHFCLFWHSISNKDDTCVDLVIIWKAPLASEPHKYRFVFVTHLLPRRTEWYLCPCWKGPSLEIIYFIMISFTISG